MTRQTKLELSESARNRKGEMLSEIQDSMIELHRTKRRRQKQMLWTAGVSLPLVLCVVYVYQSFLVGAGQTDSGPSPKQSIAIQVNANQQERVIEQNISPARIAKAEQEANSVNKETESTNDAINGYDRYIVSNADVKTREMELIDDDELLLLLKKAGVNAWMANINDERIVLTETGKRL